jgi:hypothetical protein
VVLAARGGDEERAEVDDRSGTFDYRFQGSGTFPTTLSGRYVVGHGTGGLEGLHAEGPLSCSFRVDVVHRVSRAGAAASTPDLLPARA